MMISEKIMEAIDNAILGDQSDFELDPTVPDTRPFNETVVSFLESLRIEEGIDFVVDNDDIYPSGNVDIDFDMTPFSNVVFPSWPSVSFSYDGQDTVTAIVGSSTYSMPLGIFFLIKHYSNR